MDGLDDSPLLGVKHVVPVYNLPNDQADQPNLKYMVNSKIMLSITVMCQVITNNPDKCIRLFKIVFPIRSD